MTAFSRHVLVWLLAGLLGAPTAAFAQTASMFVETNVAGATVRVDDRVRGVTDSTGAAFVDRLTVGTHTVEVRKAGYEGDSTTVDLDADLTGSVSLRLDPVRPDAGATASRTSEESRASAQDSPPATGALLVESTPGDAAVFLNGTRLGRTGPDGRAYFPEVEAGTHALSIRKDGFETQSQSVTISDDGLDRTVAVTLQPVESSSASVPSPRRTPRADASDGGYGLWSLIAAGLAGVALGTLGGWFFRRQQVAELKDDRDYWESRFRDEQGRAYRSAVGVQPRTSSPPSAANDSDEADDSASDATDPTGDAASS